MLADVRQPGLQAIAERVGERPPRAHGRRHARIATREEIAAHAFPPYWQSALDDPLLSYRRVCSYLCFYIPRGPGPPSVDHMIPKSVRWDQVAQLPVGLFLGARFGVPDRRYAVARVSLCLVARSSGWSRRAVHG